jgi:thiamine monophosphate kinase
LPLACIGIVKEEAGLSALRDGRAMNIKAAGFDHFA